MNLLILPGTGGSYTSLRPEAEIFIGLAKAGHQVTLITDENCGYAPRYKEHGLKIIHCTFDRKISPAAIRLVKHAIVEHNIDIVYATNSRNIPNAAFASMASSVKLVVYRGTTGGLYRRDPGTYLTVLHPRVDGVVCVSRAVEKYVRKRMWSRTADNVVTIYKGHDLAWYTKPAVDLSVFKTHQDNFNVACVANARSHKGLIYVVQAAKELADIKDIHILLVGGNISKEPYISLIKESGMEERIHITGYRTDAPEIMAACDVLVLPSIREGLPRVILESLAYKTPVITSANEGSMEIIDDEVNGYVVPIRDSKAIADRIKRLYNNPEILDKFVENSQDKLKNQLSAANTVANYEKYFQSLLDT